MVVSHDRIHSITCSHFWSRHICCMTSHRHNSQTFCDEYDYVWSAFCLIQYINAQHTNAVGDACYGDAGGSGIARIGCINTKIQVYAFHSIMEIRKKPSWISFRPYSYDSFLSLLKPIYSFTSSYSLSYFFTLIVIVSLAHMMLLHLSHDSCRHALCMTNSYVLISEIWSITMCTVLPLPKKK